MIHQKRSPSATKQYFNRCKQSELSHINTITVLPVWQVFLKYSCR